jgi:hypothetical protein
MGFLKWWEKILVVFGLLWSIIMLCMAVYWVVQLWVM